MVKILSSSLMFGELKMNDRNVVVPHHTEDKSWWLQHGEKLEILFVKICSERLNLNMAINPKKLTDPTVPDLLVDGKLADLKTQNTPFFTAGRYGIDPRFAVTFNRKDYIRYKQLYPEIDIYFWIDWTQLEYKACKVDYLGGIFRLPFKDIELMIEGGAPEHDYLHRKNDTIGNAKSSFILDIRKFQNLFSTTPA